ncbi:uncharacterized protein LOC109827572 isoform X1 [Asparagus officinalis]|uniref:uncharacterized protein LOC109827572 isoform X1 n=1 Tax=Asparagus officinalis TaxID=4686 RepID=UPI00098DEB12|nr:uncharacterized protein LOC109827572 isoform X1 [Asparagus officinalis]
MAALSFQPVTGSRPASSIAARRDPGDLSPLSPSPAAAAAAAAAKQLWLLYSKPRCCLCDGLKEKLNAALSLRGPHPLSSVHLQATPAEKPISVRDITENSEWERLYQYEIPVLAKILPDGTEETLPRFSPRLGVEVIQRKIAAALEL